MSIITLAAFAGGFVAGFAVGVLAAENGKVKSSDLTAASDAAISRAKSAYLYLKNHEYRSQTQNGSHPQA